MVQVLANCDGKIELRRAYSVQPDTVYRAWTDPDIRGRWLAPGPARCEAIEIDVRVGGRYRISMFNPESGNRPIVVGVYEIVEPGKRLAFTWKWQNKDS